MSLDVLGCLYSEHGELDGVELDAFGLYMIVRFIDEGGRVGTKKYMAINHEECNGFHIRDFLLVEKNGEKILHKRHK